MRTNKLQNIKETGFKVSKDYFKSLEDSILSDLKLKELSPKSGYTTPDYYFNTLEDNIINTINQTKEVKVVKFITWRKVVFATAVAASLILIIDVFFNNTKNVTINTIETASIENYIINEDVETNEFASLFTKEDLQDVQLITDGYNSETLENFVFDNLEIEDIITK